MGLTLIDTNYHEKVKYSARVFDEQEGYRLTYSTDETKQVFETGAYLHWKSGKIVDIALDLSCMSGCAHKCVFCSASKHNGEYLSFETIYEQVTTTLAFLQCAQSEFLQKCPMYTISFQGMGEPSIPNVSRHILLAIDRIREEFSKPDSPQIQFVLSTVGSHPPIIKQWADQKLPLETLQLSLHAASDEKRRQIIGDDVPDIQEVFDALAYFHSQCPDTLIKVNYLMMKINDETNYSDDELNRLLDLLQGTNYYLKVSHLNETTSSKKNGIRRIWSREAQERYVYLRDRYGEDRVYEHGTSHNLRISCGQLASYAEHASTLDPQTRERISEIYEELTERNLILFVGAGVTRTLWNADQLAKELLDEIVADSPTKPCNLTLQQIADIYRSRRKQDHIHSKLKNTITTKDFPPEFLELTMHPWRAIYTTNYDDFLERAFAQSAGKQGNSRRSFCRITQPSDFEEKAFHRSIPIIKLHGCITQPIGKQVIDSQDYMQLYWDAERQSLLQHFAADITHHSIVFSGYSMNDHHIAKILFDANFVKKVKGYLVSPGTDQYWQADFDQILLDKFGFRPVRCTFEDFLLELSRLRRKPKVFVSGSIKQVIPGVDRKKSDVTQWATAFLTDLGMRLSREKIRVRTGATATDKAGHIVAKPMKDQYVKTYIWNGADSLKTNEISEMINRQYYGMSPLDVIDRITRECNVAIFLGGSGLCMEEIHAAMSRNLLVIPIKLIDNTYASSMIHTYLLNNAEAFEDFGSDRSESAKRWGNPFSSRFLTKERLERLDMNKSNPSEAVDTVMETLRHFQLQGT